MSNAKITPNKFRKDLYPYAVKCYSLSAENLEEFDPHVIIQKIHNAIGKFYILRNEHDDTNLILFFIEQSINILQSKNKFFYFDDIIDFVTAATKDLLAGDFEN